MAQEAEEARRRELVRIDERIDMLANWLMQGRCGDSAECADAKRAEIRQLQERRAELVGEG